MSFEHPLGTDHLGRDVLTRLLLGSQLTVGYGLLALLVSVVIGVPFGVLAGFKGGLIDRIFMRIADAFLVVSGYSYRDRVDWFTRCGY